MALTGAEKLQIKIWLSIKIRPNFGNYKNRDYKWPQRNVYSFSTMEKFNINVLKAYLNESELILKT